MRGFGRRRRSGSRSWIVIGQHLQLFGWKFTVPIFPGGYTHRLHAARGADAAFIHRFTWRWDKLGIHLTHAGVILLLLGQLLTQEFAVESYIEFKEGETKNYAEHHLHNELAFIRDAGGGREEVIVIPESIVKAGRGNPA